MDAITLATMVLEILPKLVQASTEVYTLIHNTNSLLKTMQSEGRDPTAEEWDDINKQIHDLSNQLQG